MPRNAVLLIVLLAILAVAAVVIWRRRLPPH